MALFARRKFTMNGGRTGFICYRNGDARAELEWEMLVGEFDMVVYASSARWVAPDNRPMTTADVRQLAQRFADEAGVRIDLAFVDHSEDVQPRRRRLVSVLWGRLVGR